MPGPTARHGKRKGATDDSQTEKDCQPSQASIPVTPDKTSPPVRTNVFLKKRARRAATKKGPIPLVSKDDISVIKMIGYIYLGGICVLEFVSSWDPNRPGFFQPVYEKFQEDPDWAEEWEIYGFFDKRHPDTELNASIQLPPKRGSDAIYRFKCMVHIPKKEKDATKANFLDWMTRLCPEIQRLADEYTARHATGYHNTYQVVGVVTEEENLKPLYIHLLNQDVMRIMLDLYSNATTENLLEMAEKFFGPWDGARAYIKQKKEEFNRDNYFRTGNKGNE